MFRERVFACFSEGCGGWVNVLVDTAIIDMDEGGKGGI